MTENKTGRRHSPPPVIWLVVGFLMIAIAALAALVFLAWQEASQSEALRAELERAVGERQAMEVLLRGLEARRRPCSAARGLEARAGVGQTCGPCRRGATR